MPKSTLRFVSLAVGGLWLSCLLGLTLTTANPVTLNRQQVLSSNYIVEGRFDSQSSNFLVDRAYPDGASQGKLKFANHLDLRFDPEETYLVPVVISENQELVTPSPMKGIPLIYPANVEAKKQLDSLLDKNFRK